MIISAKFILPLKCTVLANFCIRFQILPIQSRFTATLMKFQNIPHDAQGSYKRSSIFTNKCNSITRRRDSLLWAFEVIAKVIEAVKNSAGNCAIGFRFVSSIGLVFFTVSWSFWTVQFPKHVIVVVIYICTYHRLHHYIEFNFLNL